MRELLACPFCRELFPEGEAEFCPDCDIRLVPMHRLPLSAEGQLEAASEGSVDPPEDQQQPLLYLGRGRGLLLALAAAGLLLFFQPWVWLEHPEAIWLSGFDLARTNATWLWGGAVGWFILLPLLLSRRTVNQLRGSRVIAATFCLMTVIETAMLLLHPPAEHHYFSSGLSFAWGLYASLAVACLATVVATRLGGRVDDLRDLPVSMLPSDRLPNESVN